MVDIRYVAVDTGGAGPRRMRPGNVRQQTRALGRRQVTTRIQSGSQQGRGKIFDSYRENIYWPIDNRCFHLVIIIILLIRNYFQIILSHWEMFSKFKNICPLGNEYLFLVVGYKYLWLMPNIFLSVMLLFRRDGDMTRR